jgi:molybdopterin-containing oxidoreductase family iron-sulfur binding subunit
LLRVQEGDWLAVTVEGRTVELPVLVQPGTALGVVATTLGYGRTKGADVAQGQGVSTATLLGRGAAPRLALGAKAARLAAKSAYTLVRTQKEFGQHDRPIARAGTAAEYREHNDFAQHMVHVPPLDQMHAEWDYSKGRKWGLAIDLSACIGCNACMVACQSENNIAVVGKEECGMHRDMHWIRIDRYEAGDPENPEVVQQPMLCQHCDNAPCENVCPVNATAHSPEGLNEQAYNRCVGTRYCGNNCPYKVRRFNYKAYSAANIEGPVRELAYNPQVTVRSRGIMEKCTFCVQRINAEKFKADNAGEPVKDGAIKTACQQACPASAIVFGDLNDGKSQIKEKREADLAYLVLEELNVRPNVSYLAKVRNPHPKLSTGAGTHERGGHG